VDDLPPVAPGSVLLVPPVPLDGVDGVDGAAPGVCEDSDGGVVVAGVEALGVLPVLPPCSLLLPPPLRLHAAILSVIRPSKIRVREACRVEFIAFPFYQMPLIKYQ
jgi:hypothetical protein